MTRDYGRPPRAEENRALIESRLAEVAAGGGLRETVTVDWRGRPTHFDVIEMPVGDLYYNPATHRIRAQRSHDSVRSELLDQNPWSQGSQEYLDFLLKALPSDLSKIDPVFTGLAESLNDYNQSDPGLITRDGVLVNGNTRRAALLQIRGPGQSMRVAVLPESCTWDDISDVELSLQLRKTHHREYSYVNRLLTIDELAKQGMPVSVIAATFRTTVPACEQDMWVFNSVQSLIERSEAQGTRLPIFAFEDKAEKLKELYRRYSKDLAVDPEMAEIVKEYRLAAIMLDFSKTDVRLIEDDFQERYLSRHLPERFQEQVSGHETVSIPGLNRKVKGASNALNSVKRLTDTALKAKAAEASDSSLRDPVAADAARAGEELRDAMKRALEPAGKDSRIRKRKQAAPTRVLDACQALDQCVTDLVISRGSRSLDEETFDEAVIKLKESLAKLALETRRTVSAPGDGVNWLITSFSAES
ncbi:transcriptional regulator [Amycolatopsis keratiniphila]|uniref:Transcriptional regulator n=1 Tax=Amycolatopsis keratiniphila subsp. keratiniphila TaxID=227715 RepID=A0A1W2LRG0_9PSEU|nr:transcriptional regulator [Amycolatopsis keratiniphila]ONF66910.1 transcriptional regulator [Amycolatopsis keratiniphila subsp. keratiniphila]